ncbi:DUF2155 domain-containing protein [Manganibacter manganicus]|uniref:DUF2155 domain-containing protein n=1 Tax=Manganibacter manganicus TaxID=1873176 RepID=UPI001FDA062A|nr:DUF2155 domain-containing protein [Pseudaminobacter manganicus]
MTRFSHSTILAAAAFAAAFIFPTVLLAQDVQGQDPTWNVQDWDSLPDDQGTPPPETPPAQTQPPAASQDEQQNQDVITEKPAPEPKVERVSNPVAEFTGLDKITGRIITFDAYINETVQFGALQVTPRVCYSRPEAEVAKTDSFVEVDEITLDRKIRRIFTGWMFAQSPGLNAVEHPVYDVWLKDCKQKSKVPPPTSAKASDDAAPATTTVNDDASKAN